MDNYAGQVVVVGAGGVDLKGTPRKRLVPKTSNPGQIRRSFGGVARNIAENLARLEVNTALLTAVGEDAHGEELLAHCWASGINMSATRRCNTKHTGSYISLMDADGDLAVAISDYSIMHCIDTAYLKSHQDLLASADILVIDLNLLPEAIVYLLDFAREHDIRLVVDPTSQAHASKLCAYLGQVYLVAPNAAETTSLCGLEIPAQDRESAIGAADHLISMGAEIAIVTLGEQGLAYADANGRGHITAVKTQVVDSTGAGDALTAGVLFGLLHDVPLDDAMRLGVTAASLTLKSDESVVPTLTPDELYNSLVV